MSPTASLLGFPDCEAPGLSVVVVSEANALTGDRRGRGTLGSRAEAGADQGARRQEREHGADHGGATTLMVEMNTRMASPRARISD